MHRFLFISLALVCLLAGCSAPQTSDPATDESDSLDAYFEDVYKRQVLVIAHRMRTVAGADHIVVLEDGHVVQQGTPAELIEQGGLYRRMVELQSESAQWRLLCKK